MRFACSKKVDRLLLCIKRALHDGLCVGLVGVCAMSAVNSAAVSWRTERREVAHQQGSRWQFCVHRGGKTLTRNEFTGQMRLVHFRSLHNGVRIPSRFHMVLACTPAHFVNAGAPSKGAALPGAALLLRCVTAAAGRRHRPRPRPRRHAAPAIEDSTSRQTTMAGGASGGRRSGCLRRGAVRLGRRGGARYPPCPHP